MGMIKRISEKIGYRVVSGQLAGPLIFIFITTMIGTMLIEAISDLLFPNLQLHGMHVITIISSGIIATAMAYLSLSKLEMLYKKIYHENEERKRAEAALEASRAEAELYVDLMSHDINNLNQVAMGYMEMTMEKLDSGEKLCEKDTYLISKTVEMLKNSSDLIENVANIRKARSGELKVGDIDLAQVLAELRSMSFKAPDKNVAINYTMANDCIVRANGLIREIFYNLIGNAIKHSISGQVRIDVDVERIDITGKKYCRVSIADNGPGISDEIKAKIFKRFERGATKTRGKGLGLYLVKELAERFKGKVWVEDRVSGDHCQGSRFVVLLPSADQLPI
jgi:signal transduction histidine kinase